MQLSTLTSSEENATVSVQNSVHPYSEVYNVLHDSSVRSTEGNFTVPQDQEEEVIIILSGRRGVLNLEKVQFASH